MEYYTLEEVADRLKMTPEDVLGIITGKATSSSGDSEMILFPSVNFRSPVQVCRRVETKDDCYSVDEAVSGYFEVGGLYDANRDSRGYWLLSFGGKSRVTLHKDGLQYFVKETKRVHESEFLVSDEELEHWMEMYGISENVEPEENLKGELDRRKPDALIDRCGYVAKRRRDGVQDEIIAAELGGLGETDKRIALLLGLNEGLNEDQHKTIKQRGRRARKDGEKILESTET